MQHQKETNLVLTLKEEIMKRNEKQIFNPLNGEESNSIIGGCTPTPEKEFNEEILFEKYDIYQI